MKLTERECLFAAHHLARDAWGRETDPDRKRHFQAVHERLFDLLQSAKRHEAEPLVFDMYHFSPALIGRGDNVRAFNVPRGLLPGLRNAWEILDRANSGIARHFPLDATQFVGERRYAGNALRNRLANAANWVERVAKCPDLAVLMRAPTISISPDGTIRVGRLPKIHFLVPD